MKATSSAHSLETLLDEDFDLLCGCHRSDNYSCGMYRSPTPLRAIGGETIDFYCVETIRLNLPLLRTFPCFHIAQAWRIKLRVTEVKFMSIPQCPVDER
eukprot:5667870-Amphidinium_carterae.1